FLARLSAHQYRQASQELSLQFFLHVLYLHHDQRYSCSQPIKLNDASCRFKPTKNVIQAYAFKVNDDEC
ncbi:MAG: hypothetical protein EBZ77_18030, partial [Chitinophagia bacterium]|nr:hypothetical protein [Chitinophagia bacterium]